jgi:hypothetical protein
MVVQIKMVMALKIKMTNAQLLQALKSLVAAQIAMAMVLKMQKTNAPIILAWLNIKVVQHQIQIKMG